MTELSINQRNLEDYDVIQRSSFDAIKKDTLMNEEVKSNINRDPNLIEKQSEDSLVIDIAENNQIDTRSGKL